MKFLGHPIHIMLIHFPSALFPMDFVCSLITYFTGSKSFYDAAFFALTGGTILGWLAVITGTFDLITVMKNKPSSMKKALIHGGINSTALIAFSALDYLAYKHHAEAIHVNLSLIIFKGLLILFLLIGNYLGGNLILKDKVHEKNGIQ